MDFKYVPLSSLKVSDKGNGEISGYRAVFGVVDEGGDVIIRGAFKDTLDQYLAAGWGAHSHDWSFNEAISYPVESYEDDHGWFVRSAFHSTIPAQNARTIAKERLRAGKTVGFSFGYGVIDHINVESNRYQTELPQYLKASHVDEGLRKAQRFPRVRILKALEAYEDSLVTTPMNKLAAATAVKSRRSGTGDFAMLRTEGLRVRSHALSTLYRSGLQTEGERLSREVEHMSLKLRVLESRLRAQRYRG